MYKDRQKALYEISKTLCKNFSLKKVYFAESIGRRLHHIAGYGDESFLPPSKVHIVDNLYVFIESLEELKEENKDEILHFIKRALGRLK